MECYLDNSATTKPCQEAVAAAVDAMTEHFGNPSSLHQNGMAAQQLLERARKTIADSLRAENSEIVFTPSGTAARPSRDLLGCRALRCASLKRSPETAVRTGSDLCRAKKASI